MATPDVVGRDAELEQVAARWTAAVGAQNRAPAATRIAASG
jgi:hypothetical protein